VNRAARGGDVNQSQRRRERRCGQRPWLATVEYSLSGADLYSIQYVPQRQASGPAVRATVLTQGTRQLDPD
jgi:hypothetical protein